jgi:AsmA protein
VKLVRFTDGRFSVARTGSKQPPLALEKVDLELRDFSAASAFPFSFRAIKTGGGEIKLDGTAGPLNDRDSSRTPVKAKLVLDKLNLDGNGLVSLDSDLQSDGAAARVTGKLRAEKLKLSDRGTPAAKPVEFDLAAEHRLADGSGRVTKGDLRIGAAAARLTGSYATRSESTVLHMTLVGDNMPVPELAAMLPALGIALPAGSSLQGGTAAVKLAMNGPVDRLVTDGTLSLNDTTLGGFDLGRKMAVIQALAGIKSDNSTKIQTLAGAIRMSPEGTAAESLQLVVPSIGEMAGGGTISPANALDFRMTAKVAGQSIPFLVSGTTADPSFRPDVKTVVTQKATSVAEGLIKGFLNRKKK